MSRGAGKVERAIMAAFEADPDNAYTTDELIELVYPGIDTIEKKHRVSVLRATKTLIERDRSYDYLYSDGIGRRVVLFNRYNLTSYAIAHLKSKTHYKCRDPRILEYRPYDFDAKSKDVLLAQLREGGQYHKEVSEGGWWWRHVRRWTAERDGEHEVVAAMEAEDQRMRAAYGI